MLKYLQLLGSYFNDLNIHLRAYCDNLALIRKVDDQSKQTWPLFPNDSINPSWDVLQAIYTLMKKLPHVSLRHVKGHQDSAQPDKELPLPARLNIRADELAGDYQSMTSHKNMLAPLITGASCLLDIAGQGTISSHIKKQVRTIRGKSALQDYLSQRYNWSFEEYCSINWKAHHQAISNWKDGKEVFLRKFIHKLLPVGKMI
jgi:hypothetical protein